MFGTRKWEPDQCNQCSQQLVWCGDSGTGSYEKIQGVIHAKINQENFLEAWGEAASSSAHLLGVVARGGKVEASQGIEIAGGVVSALTSLKIMDPVLGFALGMFSSFFSAFYEEGPDKYIMDIVQTVVPDLIEDALVKQTLQRAEDNLGNFQEDEDMWDQLARADPAARKFQCYSKIPNYNNARPDMFGDCWHGAADYPVSEGCSKFVLGGGIKAANMFALTHINVLRSCASADNSGADAYINEAHRLRAVYMLLLRQTVGFLVREWKEKMPSPKMLTYVSAGVFAGGECTGWWPTDTVDPVTGKRFVQDCNLPEADCNFVGYDEMNKPIDDCTNAYKERTFSNFEQQWLFANQFLLAYKPAYSCIDGKNTYTALRQRHLPNVQTLADCAAQCDLDKSCVHFVLVPPSDAGTGCWLKETGASFTPDSPDYIVCQPQDENVFGQFECHLDVYYGGGSLINYDVHDDHACASLCLQHSDCKAFTSTQGGGCWLKQDWEHYDFIQLDGNNEHPRSCARRP